MICTILVKISRDPYVAQECHFKDLAETRQMLLCDRVDKFKLLKNNNLIKLIKKQPMRVKALILAITKQIQTSYQQTYPQLLWTTAETLE